MCRTAKAVKGHLWSTSYFLLTTGQTTLEILKKYVESQGKENIEIKDNNLSFVRIGMICFS